MSSIPGVVKEEACDYEAIQEETAIARAESPSSLVSSSPGPEGFKNRKVQVKDGYVIVSDGEGDGSACTSVYGDPMEEWENVYLKHRKDIVDKDGFIYTPLHIVKGFADKLKKDMLIEHYILHHPTNKKKAIYRVDIMIGELRGVGQCTRKQLARQLAAIDVYEKIQLQQSKKFGRPTPMPRCGLLPGWRIDTIVFGVLFNDICDQQKLERPKFIVLPPPENKLGKFTAICRVGKRETRGENDHPWLAKKLAAKEMYEELTGNEFPLEITPMGRDTITFPKMRLLGFNPKVTNLKRKWLMEHRIKDTQVVVPSDEPDDGDLEEVEEEVQLQNAKKMRRTEFKEFLKVTLHNDPSGTGSFRQVTSSTTTAEPGTSKSFHDIRKQEVQNVALETVEVERLVIYETEEEDL